MPAERHTDPSAQVAHVLHVPLLSQELPPPVEVDEELDDEDDETGNPLVLLLDDETGKPPVLLLDDEDEEAVGKPPLLLDEEDEDETGKPLLETLVVTGPPP